MSDSTIHQAYGQPLPERPQPDPGKGEAKNDGLAVMALIFGWTIWPAGLILGHVSNHAAKQAHRRRSILAILGLVGAYFWIAIITGVIIGAAASGPDTSVSSVGPQPTISAPASVPAPTPAPAAKSTFNLPVGSTITTHSYDGSRYTVTVNSVKPYAPGDFDQPPPPGQHYVIANVTYKSVTGSVDPNPFDWSVSDANGQNHDASFAAGNQNDSLPPVTITAGQKVGGTVVLTVGNGSAHSTVIYNSGLHQVASWAI